MCCVKDYDKLLLLNLRKLIYAWNYKTTFFRSCCIAIYWNVYQKNVKDIITDM